MWDNVKNPSNLKAVSSVSLPNYIDMCVDPELCRPEG